MITLITAVPGSGKTLWTIGEILKLQKEGRRVYARINGLLVDGVLPAPDDWRETPEGSVVIYDECQEIFPSNAKPGVVHDERITQWSAIAILVTICTLLLRLQPSFTTIFVNLWVATFIYIVPMAYRELISTRGILLVIVPTIGKSRNALITFYGSIRKSIFSFINRRLFTPTNSDSPKKSALSWL